MCTCRLPLSEGCSQLSYIFKWIFLSWLHCGYLSNSWISVAYQNDQFLSGWIFWAMSYVVLSSSKSPVASGYTVHASQIIFLLIPPTLNHTPWMRGRETSLDPLHERFSWTTAAMKYLWDLQPQAKITDATHSVANFFQSTAASVMVCSDIFFGWWLMPFPLLSILDSFFLRHPK